MTKLVCDQSVCSRFYLSSSFFLSGCQAFSGMNRYASRYHLDGMKLFSSTTSSASSASSASKKRDTGGLRRLPVVKSPRELMDLAVKKVKRTVKADKKMKNARNRARKEGAETLNGLTQALCVPLRDAVKGYRYELRNLHPFEEVVADLTVRSRRSKDGVDLQTVLQELHEARVEILEAGKDWVAASKNAPTALEASETSAAGQRALLDLFQQLAEPPLLDIISLQKELRTAPIVNLSTPAVVLVGAPNVGKSSIVHAISTATPEINNYPFTTRGMTLGHIPLQWQQPDDQTGILKGVLLPKNINIKTATLADAEYCQIMDSPGLLARTERNEMEQLTMAAMQHLPTAVIYVMDLSGNAGDACSSVDDQFLIRKEIRQRFPKRPWIDVLSKFDLYAKDDHYEKDILQRFESEIVQQEQSSDTIATPAPYVALSIHNGMGVEQLQYHVVQMLAEVRIVLDAMAAVQTSSTNNTQ